MSTPAPLTFTGRTGLLTVGGLLLHGPAWDIPDLSPLWVDGAQRGQNRIVSGSPGVRAKRRRYTETEAQLRMIVIGHFNQSSVAQSNAMQGLVDNLETLRTALVAPIVTGSATVAGSYVLPGGGTPRTATVQPSLEVGDLRGARVIAGVPKIARAIVVLRLNIIEGRFT